MSTPFIKPVTSGIKAPRGRRILVVDDNDGLNRLTQKTLAKAGFDVTGVLTGSDAIQEIKSDPGLVMLLDHKLPDMTGTQIVHTLAGMGLQIPFVLMTGHGDEKTAVAMMKLGARDYLVKNLDLTALLPEIFHRIFRELETEQRLALAEDALREREAVLENIHRSAPVGIGMLSPDHTIRWPNEHLAKITGYRLDELEGMPFRNLLDPESSDPIALETEKQGIARNGISTGETRFLRRDGQVIDVLFGATQRKPGHREEGLIGCALDISERKKAEKAIEKHASNLDAIFNSAPNILVLVDTELRLEKINRKGELFSGTAATDLYGCLAGQVLNCLNAFDGDGCGTTDDCSQCPIRTGIQSTFRTGKPHHEQEGRMTFLVNGEKNQMDLLISTALVELDGTRKALLSLTDITARKQVEESLRKERYILRKAQEIGHIGTWELDFRTSRLTWTDETCRIFGLPPETELTCRTFLDCVHPDDKNQMSDNWEALIAGRPFHAEHRLLANGEVRWISEKAELEFNEKNECIRAIGFVQDITDRKKYEALLSSRIAALTEPTVDVPEINITDVIDITMLQQVMDGFSDTFGIPAVIYDTHGRSVTRPSNGSPFCRLIQSVPEGRRQCQAFNARQLKTMNKKSLPVISRSCSVDGIITGAVPLIVGSHHIANISIGPMTDGAPSDAELKRLKNDLGISTKGLAAASAHLLPYDRDAFDKVLAFMNLIGSQMSQMGFQNLRQAKLIAEKESAERLISTAFESSPEAITISRLDGSFIYVNPGTANLTGYDRSELIGATTPHLQIWADEDDRLRLLSLLKDQGTVTNFETDFRLKDGSLATGLVSANLIEIDREPHVLSITCDIRDLKKAQKDLQTSEARLQQAQKMESIGNLAGGIAHDFNNILFPIIGMSEMLMDDLPPTTPEYQSAEEIFKAARRGSDLVKQILAFSRQPQHQVIPVKIQSILREVLRLMRSSIPSNIEIHQDIQDDCGLVMADPTQLHQIAMNLITNAYHAVESNGGSITVQLKAKNLTPGDSPIRSLKPGGYALMSVMDTGCGIDPALMDKIFEPYFTTKAQGKGTGLGLAVVYGIVRKYKGEIHVDSNVGKGTAFTVFLPLMERASKQEPADSKEVDSTGSERILLVDDEEQIVLLEQQLLERLGYQVSAFHSSMDALQAFEASPDAFDLVITDMTMPGLTGDELAGRMISINPEIPVIICTGFSEKLTPEKARSLGIQGFLMKPVVKSDMAGMVRTVLDTPATITR